MSEHERFIIPAHLYESSMTEQRLTLMWYQSIPVPLNAAFAHLTLTCQPGQAASRDQPKNCRSGAGWTPFWDDQTIAWAPPSLVKLLLSPSEKGAVGLPGAVALRSFAMPARAAAPVSQRCSIEVTQPTAQAPCC